MDKQIRVTHLSTTDIKGGAARAAFRINKALNHLNAESIMVVRDKQSEDVNARVALPYRPLVDKTFTLTEAYLNRLNVPFSIDERGLDLSEDKNIKRTDIINLHWINDGFVSLESLELIGNLQKPLVWTLHDMWAFTGGCHYSGPCTGFRDKCGKCPILLSNLDEDLTRAIWLKKKSIYEKLDLTIVTCSRWLAQCAQNSSLFKDLRVEVIPNPIDVDLYKPIERKIARQILNLPEDKRLVLFGAINALNDKRKGFEYLQKSLFQLKNNYEGLKVKLELLVFGAGSTNSVEEFPFETHFLGNIKDEYTLMLCYNAADVFVAPSLEDNLPNTVMESLACGTPVVAFNVGGLPDLVEHKRNGYLAKYRFEKDLAEGLRWVLEDQDRMNQLRLASRQKVLDNFTYEKVGKKYLDLYRQLIKDNNAVLNRYFQEKGRKLYIYDNNFTFPEMAQIEQDDQLVDNLNINSLNTALPTNNYELAFYTFVRGTDKDFISIFKNINRVLKSQGTLIVDFSYNKPTLYFEAVFDKIMNLLGFIRNEVAHGYEKVYIKTRDVIDENIKKAYDMMDFIRVLLNINKKYGYTLSEDFVKLLTDYQGNVAIFGAGVIGKSIYEILKETKADITIYCFFDNEEYKWNLNFCGIKVLPPQSDFISEVDKIIIASQYGRIPIITQLLKLGVAKEKIICFEG